MTVILWEIFDDKNCDPKRVIANPRERTKNRFPVSAWQRFISSQIKGVIGGKMIRAKILMNEANVITSKKGRKG